MAKFLIVKEKPLELKKGEFVIDKPSFLEEIELNKNKASKNGLTGAYHLKVIADSIMQNYDPENAARFSARIHNFVGVPYKDDAELNDIVVKMFADANPEVFLKYVDKKIKTRPFGTTLVYYVDSELKGAYDLFYRHGLSDARDFDKKAGTDGPKKTVGKPAITKEQAELIKQTQDI
jgi:hypothetical protein